MAVTAIEVLQGIYVPAQTAVKGKEGVQNNMFVLAMGQVNNQKTPNGCERVYVFVRCVQRGIHRTEATFLPLCLQNRFFVRDREKMTYRKKSLFLGK